MRWLRRSPARRATLAFQRGLCRGVIQGHLPGAARFFDEARSCRQVREQKPCQPDVIWIFSDVWALSGVSVNPGAVRVRKFVIQRRKLVRVSRLSATDDGGA